MAAQVDLLVTPAQLSRFNVPSAFLSQFSPRPIEVLISTAGALGVMAIEWRFLGDSEWSAPVISAAGATWAVTIDDAFVDLAFEDGAYVVDTQYAIDTGGTVTPGSGAIANLSAAFFDLRQNSCTAVRDEAMTLCRDALRPPLVSWGDDVRTHAAAMAYAILKRGRGATAQSAGVGDEHIFLAEDAGRKFFEKIGENGKPDTIVDSSATDDGPLFAAYPAGDTSRGW